MVTKLHNVTKEQHFHILCKGNKKNKNSNMISFFYVFLTKS